jgi:uncharacterized membrane protein YfcA
MWLAAVYGAAIGAVLGLTGAGGGILAVPALVLRLHWTLPQATPVALLAVGLAAALGAADGLRQGLVRWRAALLMAVLGVSISPLGVIAARALPASVLTMLFAAAMLASSIRLIFQSATAGASIEADTFGKNCMMDKRTGRLRWTVRCATTLAGIGTFSGLLTGMLGVGGGFLLVPAFRQWTGIHMQGIVATSLMVVALISLGAAAGAVAAGAALTSAGYGFIAAAMIGMALGRAGARFVAGRTLQLGFATLSAAVAVLMVARTLGH